MTIPNRERAKAPLSPPPAARSFKTIFGARSLTVAAVLLQIVLAYSLSRRLIAALEYLSLHPGNLVFLAALGALATGLLGWAWWLRQWGVAAAFCVTSALWWLIFIGQSL